MSESSNDKASIYWKNVIEEKDKIKAFDELAEMFFERNFGESTKSEIELKMFSIYMDTLANKFKNDDGILDYGAVSDYKMSKQLGVPQERVRTLKVRKQAKYPIEFSWRDSLVAIKNNIRYDDKKKKVVIPVSDPNLYNEIRNFIEENGGYIEIQRGGNILQMLPEHFFLLLYSGTEDEKTKKKLRENFVKKAKKINEDMDVDSINTDEEMSMRALAAGEKGLDFFIDVVEGISNPLVGIMKALKTISRIAQNK